MKVISQANNHFSGTVTGIGYTETVRFDANIGNFTAEVRFPSASTGQLELTMDSFADIDAGIAQWLPWSMGVVSTRTQVSGKSPQAVRGYNTGAGTMQVLIRGTI